VIPANVPIPLINITTLIRTQFYFLPEALQHHHTPVYALPLVVSSPHPLLS